MQIQHTDDGKRGAFFIKEQDETLAEMIYKWSNESTFIIEHTEVSDKLAGKGVGKQLVNASVEFARANNYKIIPLCAFARKVFERTKEYEDVLR
jgi:predicted GNAT family acetyltransferase